jgi:Arc/MetJ family transcription regulator
MMRTTVDVDPKLLAEASEITGESSPSKTVNFALRELVRRQKLKELREMLGTIGLADTWREDEARELEDMQKNSL